MSTKQKEEIRYAIPVGTSELKELSKFLFDLRDNSCTQCKTGYKSVLPKFIGGKVHQIPVVCTCIPYIVGEDKDSNLVVVYKGARELWPNKKRPEQYIQNDLVRKAEFERAKNGMKEARGQSRAHDGVQSGKYTLGSLSPAEREELGKDVVKSLAPKFVGEVETEATAESKKFLTQRVVRNVAMRNSEGHIIMVDNETALNMQRKNIAIPVRPENVAPPAAPPAAPETPEVRRGRGRPVGSKNKPKGV